MRKVYLLGATGSIGTQALEVLRLYKEEYRLISVSCKENIEKLEKIIDEFQPLFVSVENNQDYIYLKNKYPNISFGYGEEGLLKAATYQCDILGEDVVIVSVVGMVGLLPTVAAIKMRRTILIANKETLVVAGDIITSLVKEYNVLMLPIDSEHSAIFQCINQNNKDDINRIIITASGGAFRDLTRSQLENVTIEDALNHPNWSMGKKITVDCATMVNKGLEVIEAHYLFNMPYEKIFPILHKESIVHSMVEYNDGSIIAQMGVADMHTPIQYALTYPKKQYRMEKLDLVKIGKLSFENIDDEKYPLLKLAYQVGKMAGIMPAVYNASNEEAVMNFINKKIKFLDIEKIIFKVVNNTVNIKNPSLEQIIDASKKAKKDVQEIIMKGEIKC